MSDELYDNPELDNQIVDTEEYLGLDVQINPNYYVHKALEAAQAALAKDDIRSGFLQYRIIINHLETVARASNMLPKDYDEQLNKYIAEDKTADKEVKDINLARKKLEIILKHIFSNRLSKDPVRLY